MTHSVRLYPWRIIGWTPESGLYRFIASAAGIIREVGYNLDTNLDTLRASVGNPPKGADGMGIAEREVVASGAELVRVDEEWTPQELQKRTTREGELRAVVIDYYKSQMKEDHHYYTLRDGGKPALSKEGALNLTSLFKVTPHFTAPQITTDADRHREVIYHCSLITRAGQVAAMGDGSCTTRESKYAYRLSSRKCPTCGAEAIRRRKADKGGGWICIGNELGGCWAQFAADDKIITDQVVGRVTNPDLADQYNTVLKMAQKRALVAAALHLPLVSELFTQDLEEREAESTTKRADAGEGGGSEGNPPVRVEKSPQQKLGENLKTLGFASADVEIVRDLSEKVTGKRNREHYATTDYVRMIYVTSLMIGPPSMGLEEAIRMAEQSMPRPKPESPAPAKA